MMSSSSGSNVKAGRPMRPALRSDLGAVRRLAHQTHWEHRLLPVPQVAAGLVGRRVATALAEQAKVVALEGGAAVGLRAVQAEQSS